MNNNIKEIITNFTKFVNKKREIVSEELVDSYFLFIEQKEQPEKKEELEKEQKQQKNDRCVFILTKGKSKGNPCSKKALKDNEFCRSHFEIMEDQREKDKDQREKEVEVSKKEEKKVKKQKEKVSKKEEKKVKKQKDKAPKKDLIKEFTKGDSDIEEDFEDYNEEDTCYDEEEDNVDVNFEEETEEEKEYENVDEEEEESEQVEYEEEESKNNDTGDILELEEEV